MKAHCRLIVFAKAPVPGLAKTRFIPALGARGAARLAERLLEHSVQQACHARIGPVELCCAPNAEHAAFTRLTQRYAIALETQGDGDLGARMSRALARALATHERAVLIGSDIPALDAHYLQAAARALEDHAVVFGPANDGGYVLVGSSVSAAGLFEGIQWGTSRVMQQTRQRLVALGLRHHELAPLSDVDVAEDLKHVPAHWLA